MFAIVSFILVWFAPLKWQGVGEDCLRNITCVLASPGQCLNVPLEINDCRLLQAPFPKKKLLKRITTSQQTFVEDDHSP